jgi:hypothetical protein
VSGEHVFVELDEVGVVTLGELPDEILRNGHLYRLKVLRFAVRAAEVFRVIKQESCQHRSQLKHG